MSVLILITALLIFTGLIITHEMGHFFVAKRNGVKIEEFGLFFPPAIYKRKTKSGWIFSINIIPLGGFVRLKGEHDADDVKGGFGLASLAAKSRILIAGVIVNIVTAIILLTILALSGMPKIVNNQFTIKSNTHQLSEKILIGDVQSDSPAAKGGLKEDDIITAIGQLNHKPETVESNTNLPNITKSFAGEKVNIYYTRAGKNYKTETTILTAKTVNDSHGTKGYLGVEPVQLNVQRSTWSAPIDAVGLCVQFTALTFQGIGHAIGGLGSLIAGAVTHNNKARQNGQNSASGQVGGLIAIVYLLKSSSDLGWSYMLLVMAIISLTLGIMNFLPLPPLDGGKFWLILATHGIGRPMSQEREEAISVAGFLFFGFLFILLTYNDFVHFILNR
jgi:regulator of sigma E protease